MLKTNAKTTVKSKVHFMSYSKDDLLFAPLGGSGEIGMNVNLYHFRDSWIMVDLGISFPDESTPGVDLILPDLKFIARWMMLLRFMTLLCWLVGRISFAPLACWHLTRCGWKKATGRGRLI